MKRIMILLGLIALINCGANLNAQSNDKVIEIFQSISDEWASHVTAKNLDGITSLYTDDATIDANTQEAVTGKDAIRDYFSGWFDSFQSIKNKQTIISTWVFGNNAYVYGSWEEIEINENGDEIELSGNWVNYFVKEKSTTVWKIRHELWNDAQYFEFRKKD